MNVDGSTGEKYKGVGFIVAYTVSNNEAKYEALLARFRMAQSLKIDHFCVRSDSQVVIGKVTSVFAVRGNNSYFLNSPRFILKKYLVRRMQVQICCPNLVQES